MPTLETRPLSAADFAMFGEVIEFDAGSARAVNEGWALRSDTAARLEGTGGAPLIAFYRTERQALPLSLTLLERHPVSSQTFIAISVPRFLVVVAPPDAAGLPDRAQARAFVGLIGQGINYRPGVWHAPITALDRDGDFLMLMWERGSDEDCVVHRSSTAITIAAQAEFPDSAHRAEPEILQDFKT